MTQGLFEIESRLNQWAYYRINLNQGGLGWPSKNLLLNFAGGGGTRHPTSGVCLIIKFDHSQQTDSWIRAMGKVRPKLEEALTIYYTCKLPTPKLAKALGVSKSTLLQRVHDAKVWLAARLSSYLDAQSRQNHG